MKLFRFIFNIKTFLVLMGILVILLLATRFVNLSPSQEEIDLAFSKTDFAPVDEIANFEAGDLHYVKIGDSSKPTLILIHGSPGSWDAWVSFITETNVLENYQVIAIDRTGYGKTSLEGRYSLLEQSQFLKPIMDQYCSQCIVAGHSYGGGLAMQVALDYQAKIKGAITIAGTVAAPFQKLKWYNYAMNYSPAQWLVSSDFANSNREMWGLQEGLPLMNNRLMDFKSKIAIIQGNEDRLVDKQSAQFLEKNLMNAKVKMIIKDDMDHFVIWSDMNLIIDALKWLEEN